MLIYDDTFQIIFMLHKISKRYLLDALCLKNVSKRKKMSFRYLMQHKCYLGLFQQFRN